jgi:hypothetical protein
MPNEATPIPPDKVLMFEEGRVHEADLKIKMGMAGIPLIEQETYLQWKTLDDQGRVKFHITGHVDGVYAMPWGKKVHPMPVEIKSMSDHIWNGIAHSGPGVYKWKDVRGGFQKRPWLRKYFGQITLYMLCKEFEHGIFYLKNKISGGLAQVNVNLDWKYADSLVKRATEIEENVRAQVLPDRIPFDDWVCGKACDFLSHCCPAKAMGPPIKFLADERVDMLCQIRRNSKEDRDQYQAADKKLKEWAKANEWEKCVIPGWLFEKKFDARGAMKLKVTEMKGGDEGGDEDGEGAITAKGDGGESVGEREVKDDSKVQTEEQS